MLFRLANIWIILWLYPITVQTHQVHTIIDQNSLVLRADIKLTTTLSGMTLVDVTHKIGRIHPTAYRRDGALSHSV